jgi:hypothetical protein
VSVPVGNIEVVMLPAPLESVAVPSNVDPLMNSTVPVGVPVPGLTATTLAVSVTAWPNTGEVGEDVRVEVVDACPTVTVVAVEVWPAKLVSPEYWTVIEFAPSASVLVETLPVPLASVAEPSEVVPLKNWTVPVGVPAPGATAATVAVSVTGWPNTGVVVEGINVVLVVDWATVTVTAVEVLGAKFESPTYVAVIELAATGSVVEFSVAVPFVESKTVPSEVVPLKNWTLPVGVGEPVGPVTVAVRPTDWPNTGDAGVNVTAVVL